MTCHPRRDLALRYAEGSARAPVAPTAQRANPTERANSKLDTTWGKVRDSNLFVAKPGIRRPRCFRIEEVT